MTANLVTRLSRWGLAIALVGLASTAPGQTGGIQVLTQLEGALEEVIERCERSVVSITRTSVPLETLLAQNAGRARRGAVMPAAGNGVFFPLQNKQPIVVGGLQPVVAPASSASGAGVVFDTDEGLILTQYRVVKLGETHFVTDVEGQRYSAKIRAADPRSGLAILAIDKRFPPGTKRKNEPFDLPALTIGKAEDLKKGRIVIAIGNPFSIDTDGQPTASWGSLTNTAMKAPNNENLNDIKFSDGSYRTTLHHFGSLIQTDAKLGWNANGGALVNLKGELVGVTTTAAAVAGHEQPAGYAIPLNEAMRRAVDSMRRGVEPEYGLLGVQFSNDGAARSRKTGAVGIAVGGAFRGGPAQRAGLRKNDLLIEVASKPVATPSALQLTVGSLPPGLAVPVKYERNGEQLESTVTLGKAYIREGQIVSRSRLGWRGILVDYATAIPPEVLGQKAAGGYLDTEGCVVVRKVEEGSVSWESGVRPHSFISHVSGRRVTTPAEFYAAVRDEKDNVKLKFTQPSGKAAAGLN